MDDRSIIAHYDRLLETHSNNHEMVGWGSQESQVRRFEVFCQLADLTGKSVLDVGCGIGDLYAHLNAEGIACKYVGVDINPRMIAKAENRFPDANFQVTDILTMDGTLPTYDYVFLSGVFNLGNERLRERMKAMIQRMYRLSHLAVAFNMLSMRADRYEPGECYTCPGEMIDFCLTITRRVTMRHDYMPHDFTVYMYRDE